MKKLNSITLMIMGTGLLPVAYILENVFLKCVLLLASIILNIIAIVKNFKEKRENKL
ncbi:MAG TPA: hypothetical protein VK623_07310 [Flavobacterium sp.]|nr:hypothetical protein [Flavobacterium sp.]